MNTSMTPSSMTVVTLLLFCNTLCSTANAAMYDCTPREKPLSMVHRVIHNVLHPHHRVYPKPQMCGNPDLLEVVVTADPPNVNLDDVEPSTTLYGGAGGPIATYPPSGGWVFAIPAPGASNAPTAPVVLPEPRDTQPWGRDPRHAPHEAPELSTDAYGVILVLGLLAIMRGRRPGSSR
jgi:hypothetical protein